MKPPRDGLTPEFRGWLHEHEEELSNDSLRRFLDEVDGDRDPNLVAMLAGIPGATLTCQVCGDVVPADDWAFHVHSVPECRACGEPLTGTRCANQECHRCSVFPKGG